MIFDTQLKEERNYWLKRLAGIAAPTGLEPDHHAAGVRPVADSAGRLDYWFDAALSGHIHRLTGSSPFLIYALLVSGLKVCLHRYTGAVEITVGSPPLAEYGEANALVIVNEVREEESFRELLLRVRQSLLDAYAHQHYPYRRLLKESAVMNGESGASKNAKAAALFDIAAEFEGFHGRLTDAGESLRLRFKKETAGSDASHRLGVVVEYDEQRYSRHLMTRFIGHYEQVLRMAVADTSRRVGELEVLNAEERQLLLVEWNQTKEEYPHTTCLHQLFEAQVERSPEAVALEFDDRQVSYHELNARSNQLAYYLRQQGVGPESRVSILIPRSVEMVVALLGILKAGGAYLPLDPAYPRERLRFIIQDAGLEVLVTQRESLDVVPESQAKTVCMDVAWSAVAGQSTKNPAPTAEAENLAYVIYTSGSTGQPKGVMVPHRGVVNYLHWCTRSYRVEEGSGSAVHSPLTFDLTVTSLWAPLLAGKRAVLLPEKDGIEALAKSLDMGQEFSLIKLTPSHLKVLGQSIRPGHAAHQTRAFVVGGEALQGKVLEPWRDHAPNVRVINEYGPTEAVVGCCVYEEVSGAIGEGSVPIGRPISNTELYILDQRLEPVGIGMTGEIYIGGAGVTRGYLGRGELTGERFIPHPYSSNGGERLYRTGDLARYLPGGEIEYLGRKDHQVKVRGYRIELGEIEATLALHEHVKEAVVIARGEGGEGGDNRLVAYVVAKAPDTETTVEQRRLNSAGLREYLRTRLPDYLIPARFVLLDHLPLTSNGKLDRKALPRPEQEWGEGEKAYVPPRTPAEELLAGIFKEVLRLDRVGTRDNFFEIGGDSILSIQVVSRARRAGLLITPSEVFQHQTVEALAAAARVVKETVSEIDIGVGTLIPTPIIRWLLERGGPIGRFSQGMLLQVPAALEQDHLIGALQAVLDHHDALRLRLIRSPEDGDWGLEIGAVGSIDARSCARRVDLSGLDEHERQTRMAQEAEAAGKRLDPEAGLMIQVVWFDSGARQSGRLLLVIHHLAVDGVSWRILLPDLKQAWDAMTAGKPPELGPRSSSFRRWAGELQSEARNPERVKEMALWSEILREATPLLSAGELDVRRDTVGHAGHLKLKLPASVTGPLLTKVPAAFHGGINEALLTALAVAAARWRRSRMPCAGNEILIDLEGHGREEIFKNIDLSRTVGWFTTLYPVRLDPGALNLEEAGAGGVALGKAFKSIKEQLRRLPDRGLGYGLLRYLNPETRTALAGLSKAQLGFNYLGRFAGQGESADWGMAPENLGIGGSSEPEMPLSHVLEVDAVTLEQEDGPCLVANWTWAPALVKEQEVRELVQGWFCVLEALVRHTEQPEAGGLTPSDVKLVSLSQEEIELLESRHPGIEEILPLTPLQKGLLFHSRYDEQWPDVYMVQLILSLEGAPDEISLKAAIQTLFERHANLRAGFEQEGLREPVQVIRSEVPLPWEKLDLSGLEQTEQEQRLAQLLEQDRNERFNLARPPLLRFKLIRLSGEQYRLTMTNHHILLDGWSMPVLMEELMSLYASKGQAGTLRRVTPYREYLGWSVRQDKEAARSAWAEELGGLEEGTRLTVMPSGKPAIPEMVGLDLSEALTASLTELARRRHLTLNTLAQGAWGIVLSWLMGREDVVFGITVSGRPGEIVEIESMIGLFINTLPLRMRVNPEERLIEMLSRLQEKQARLMAHQHLGLVEIQQLAGVGELFDTLMVFENYPVDRKALEAAASGLRIKSVQSVNASHYPLSLIVELGKVLQLGLQYRPDQFERSRMEAMLKCLERVLEALATDPEQRIGGIDLLAAEERKQILEEWNRTGQDLQQATLPELFEEQVRRTPRALAMICGEREMSYSELDAQSNRLANFLLDNGLSSGSMVALLTDDPIEIITGILGVLKAGGIFVPLDPSFPDHRLAVMAEQVDPGWYVVAGKYLDKLSHVRPAAGSQAKAVCLDGVSCAEGIERHAIKVLDGYSGYERTGRPAIKGNPEAACSIYFSSGSTGKPKAIVGKLKGIDHFIRWEIEELGVKAGTRVSQLASPSFDGFLKDAFVPLCAGGVVCAPERRSIILEPRKLIDWLESRQVEVLHCIPSVFRSLINEGLDSRSFASMKYVVMAGEPLLPADVKRWMDVFGDRIRLVNLYGTTETSLAKFYHLVTREDVERPSIPIGRPIEGAAALIINPRTGLCGVGVVGEIHIQTPYRGLGYYGEPELTREVFIPNPLSEDPSDIVHKTGDYGRWLPGGILEYLGRRDQQVKVRGVRIELSEIESLLRSHDAVQDVAVIDREDANGNKFLVAYLTVTNGTGGEQLRGYLAERLPEAMLPSAFVKLEKLPRTLNGKIDRKALPPLSIDQTVVKPQTPLEEIVSGIWCEVLKLPAVDRTANFFNLGGHSLLVTQVMSRVRETLKVELPVRSLFEAPTVERLSRLIQDRISEGKLSEQAAIKAMPREGERGMRLPLSFAQQRLWFLDQLEPGKATYNIPGAVRLEGRLDLEALERSVNEIVRRHEILRTRFEAEEGEPVQVIEEWEPRKLEIEDLTSLGREKREEQTHRITRQEAETGFDLGRGPLLRVKALKLEEEEHMLLFAMHHIVSDGWSMGILVREFGALYRGYSQGESSPLEELEIQYADYAKWQREYLAGEVMEAEIRYWKERLQNAAVLELPADHARPAAPSYRGSKEKVSIGNELSEGLRRLSWREGATLFMLLMAAFKVILMRYSGEEDLSVGTVIANRTRKEVEGLIGFFVNTLVFRTDLGGNPSFRELIQREKEVALEAYAHQDVPFEKLVEEINPERDLSRSPLFQVMMVLQNTSREELEIKGLKVSEIGEETGMAKFDLTLGLTEGTEGIAGCLEYSLDLYDGETIRRIARHFERVVEELLRDAEQRIRDIELLSEAEKRQIIEEWNETETEYGETLLVHEMISEQAIRSADMIAVSSEQGELSYGELERRTNQLAHYLKTRNIGREDLVGICAERSAEMVIAILGVMKAGAAYIPIDPADPKQRIESTLEDADVKLLLTQERLIGPLGAQGQAIVCLDKDWDQIGNYSCEYPAGAVDSDGLAYVIYTSGSTGKPKGAMNTHQGIRNRLLWMQEMYKLNETDRVLQKTTFSFDVSVWEFLWPLMTGAVLVMARPGGHKDTEYLLKVIKEEEITTIHFVPSMLGVFLEEPVEEATSLRRVICSGEALSKNIEHRLRSRTEAQVSNLYGPTEAAIDVTYWISEGDGEREVVPIGKPIANIQMYVLDQESEPAPVGVRGDLYISGVGLARGYVRRPGLTGEKFIPNPFSRKAGQRLYRTGDVARYLSDGNIEFVGRADDQVKLRGYRIELGEIQATLCQHPSVKQSVVVVREDERGDKRLIGYVVGEEGATESLLKRHVRERLPEYMVPEAILLLEEIPLTATGKIDRKRLPIVKNGSRSPEKAYAPPRTPIEEILAGIFEEVLRLDRVGRDDNFFEIGGHSLLATRVISRLRNAFGVEIGVRSIFEEATVAGLARRIEEAISKDQTPEERLRYWKKQLGSKLPVLGPSVPGHRVAAKSISLPAELCESLKALGKRESATLSMVLLAAFKTLLHRYTAEPEIVIGAARVNRNRAEIEHLTGCFVDILPMKTDLGGNPRFTELLQRVREAALGAYIHQEAPFETLVEEVESARPPLFNITFGVQHATENDAQLMVNIEPEWARFDLTLRITQEAQAMKAAWTYSADLFEEETIIRMHNHFETLLSSIVARPNAPLDELEMLSETERAQQTIKRAIRDEYNYNRFKSVRPKAVVPSED